MSVNSYRGWAVYYDPKPIPTDKFDWEATHPDFDGEGDSRAVHAASFKELAAEIDNAIFELDEGCASGAVDAIAGHFGHRYFESEAKARQIVAALNTAGFEIVLRERAA